MARDERLWVVGAYATMLDALENVDVAPDQLEQAVDLIENKRSRVAATKWLQEKRQQQEHQLDNQQ